MVAIYTAVYLAARLYASTAGVQWRRGATSPRIVIVDPLRSYRVLDWLFAPARVLDIALTNTGCRFGAIRR